MKRYTAIKTIFECVEPHDLVLTTTGMISREAFVAIDRPGNFYMIGSMGLVSSLGLGLALLNTEQRIIIIEGDGSALMSLGTLPLIASESPKNLIHIVLDNEAYESTGGQPSISKEVNLRRVAESSGYAYTVLVSKLSELKEILQEAPNKSGPIFLLVKVNVSRVEDIPRVSLAPEEIRDRFKNSVKK